MKDCPNIICYTVTVIRTRLKSYSPHCLTIRISREITSQSNWKRAKLFKTNSDTAAEILLPLMTKVWEDKRIPDDWNETTITRILKKGALNDCNNWRGIIVLSIPTKILAKIIGNKLLSIIASRNVVDSRLREEKLNLGKERVVSIRSSLSGTSSNSVQNDSENFISTLWIFKKAFDSIHKNSLWKILRHYRVPQEMVSTIQFYNNFNCRVVTTFTVFLCYPE